MEMNNAFAIDPEGIDPSRVPSRALSGGGKIPAIGLGTFGSDHASPLECAESVRAGISLGYRHIDCASVYGNEREIGGVLSDVLKSGAVKREELWITSKVWNDRHGAGDVLVSCAQSLKDLGLEYLDLFLVHWPFPNYHKPGCSVDYRSPDAKAYIHESYMKTWRQMERLVDMGLVRHIGTSNMTIPKLKLVLRDCRIKPACNEMELHPTFQQPELLSFVVSNGIVPIAYSPIGSPDRPERDRTPTDAVDIRDPIIVKIAQERGIHPAAVCVKWSAQKGLIPIPFSTKKGNLLNNLKSVCDDPLTPEEMREIGKADKNSRLIKGQVFLWKDGQTWEDLWDLDGTITPQ